MDALFLLLYKFFSRRRLVLFTLVIITAGIAVFLSSRIRFEEDISRMITGGSSSGVMSKVVEQSKMLDKLIITISSKDSLSESNTEELIASGDLLADTLQSTAFQPYVKGITYKVADTLIETMFNMVNANLPFFLEEQDYARFDTLTQPAQIEEAISRDLNNLLSPASFSMKQMIIRDPLGMGSMALQRLGAYQNDENYKIYNGCIFSKDLKHLMMFVSPVYASNETSENSTFLRQFDDAVQKITGEHKNLQIEIFGSVAIGVGNAERLKKDIRLTLSITIILLTLIITFSIKKKKLFPFIFLPAVFGGLVAVAVLYLVQGKVSVISLSIGTVILAITVDYALHITTHFKHKHSIIDTIRDVSFPIIVCGFATAFEFLTLVFVSSESLHELGILAAVSVVTAAFFTMVVIPHILDATRSKTDETEEKNVLEKVLDKITQYGFEKNKLLLLFMLVYTGIAVIFMNKVGFETDMMKMNYMSDRLKEAENRLNRINDAKLNSVYVVAYGNTLQEALVNNEKILSNTRELKDKGVVKSFSSPGSLLMSDSLQQVKINRWNQFWSGIDRDKFLKIMDEKAVAAGFRPGSFPDFEELVHKQFSLVDSASFKTMEALFFVDNISVTPQLASIVTIVKVDNKGKDETISKLNAIEGSVVIDRKSVLSQIVSSLGTDFNFIANVSLILILLVLIIAFGRIELGVITFIPIFVSWIWTLGFMGILGIKFNIFNIIISSFITGLGIDYSIYIMQGLVQGYTTNNRNLLSYKTCILISVMISISGTGVLILAKHPALYSIALISIFGLLSIVLISYTFQPLLFNYLINKKGQKRKLPVIFSDLVITVIVFSIFLIGCLFMNILLPVVLLLPISSGKKRILLHRGMQFWCKVPVYAMLHIKKQIINPEKETFSKPAFIISNHQSHIDLLLLLMLHPKLIVLTTKWVWNNPIYALVIRYLDYYPVMEGYGDLTGKLKAKMEAGYSIIVFPEGSRSADCSITRFHKGAFLMAQTLKADLLPIFIHGAGDCMNKGENHLRGGSITVKICKRIKPGDALYGADYHEMTRSMLQYYRREYKLLKEQLETPAYFRRMVIRNYVYKGPVIEWYTRIKLLLEHNYEKINSLVPRKATIVDIGCGYGYMSYILGFVSSERTILGIDYDQLKIELAQNCISKTDAIEFVSADAAEYPLPEADIFILSDVLHYLSDEKQDQLINNCMSRLNPGGKILIRDADSDLVKRHRGTRYTEFFSTRSGFNKAKDNQLFFFSSGKLKMHAENKGFEMETIDQSRFTSNFLYVLKKK